MKWQALNALSNKKIEVGIDNGRVISKTVGGAMEDSADEPTLMSFPGLVDLQVNGYHGTDMSDASLDVAKAELFCRELAQLGVTGFLPTLTTNSIENLGAALSNLDRLATDSSLFGAMMLGVHLEGPFISPEDGPRGAHPKQFCMAPDVEVFNRLQEKANGRICILTLSPEYESASEFILQVSSDVIVSIGHTNATPLQIQQAVKHGATMSTHLGNGMHKEILRHPNYLWEQIAEDRLNAGLIADGVHLDEAVIKSMIRAKDSSRCFLVSDSTLLSGEPPGVYENSALGDVEVTEDRRLVIAGQTKFNAGAYRPLIDAFPFLLNHQIASLEETLLMSSLNPLHILELDSKKYEEENFVLFEMDSHNQMQIQLTVINGEAVYTA